MYRYHQLEGLDDVRNQVAPIPPGEFRERLGMSEIPGWLSYTEPLGLDHMGVAFIEFPPGRGHSFVHSHDRHEEFYMILSGSGEMWIDGEVRPIRAGTAIKVDPSHKRALRNTGTEPMKFLVVSASDGTYPKRDGNPFFDENPWT